MGSKNKDIFAYVDNFKIHEHIESVEIKKSEKDDYFLSIVIPTYKRPKELKEAIDSALNQEGDLFEYEVLVVDNNPERDDETEQLIATYANPNLSYFKNSENIGMTGNWNRGFLIAKGKWVTMLHDDDLLYDFFLLNISKYTTNIIDAIISDQIRGQEYKAGIKPSAIDIKKIDCSQFVHGNIIGPPVGLTIEKGKFVDTGGFNNEFYPSIDYHWYVSFSRKNNLYRIKAPLVFYRTSIGETNNPNTQKGFLVKDFYILIGILTSICHFPYSIAEYIIGYSTLKRAERVKNRGVEIEFSTTDIGINKEKYTGCLRNIIAYIMWFLLRLFLKINRK